MTAQHWPVLLLVVLNLGIFAHPCDTQELRCQCIQVTSECIPLKFIRNILVIFENIYCNIMEVIAILKSGDLICLDPKTECVKALVKSITKRLVPKDQMGAFQGMKFLYCVDLEKPLYLSFV